MDAPAMGFRGRLAALGNLGLRALGAELVRIRDIQHYRRIEQKFLPVTGLSHGATPLPETAAGYLRPDNPRLAELRARYRLFNCPAIQHSIWQSDRLTEVDLPWFRGDNPYVFQYLAYNSEVTYLLTTYYLQTQDRLGLLHKLTEDGLFGAHTFWFNGEMQVSRDLLDSVSEILYLDRELGISQKPGVTLLDIGAGYGRLPYRLASAFPNVRVLATDAIPESTFLSEFYLGFRNVSPQATVVPLDEIEAVLSRERIDCATNIHSFSECTLSSICWWLDLLVKHGVRYLLIIPNAKQHEGTKLLTGEVAPAPPIDYLPVVEQRGYKRILMRPKYSAPSVQKHGVSPTHYHLFELQDWRPSA
jgi:hypothetical protein